MNDHFLIKHKEIEGDQINALIIHPESKNQLYVHSRDNCIRLIDYETSRGTRVKRRFFGSKCNNFMIKSCLSPDGKYLVSGSETGRPYIWDAETEEAITDINHYECQFLDIISDCDWNPRYNMFAVVGFGQEFPVLVYVFERERREIEEIFFRQGKLTSQINVVKQELANDPDFADELLRNEERVSN